MFAVNGQHTFLLLFNNPRLKAEGLKTCRLEADRKLIPPVIPPKGKIQFSRTTAWMPACAGMTIWFNLVAANAAHVRLAHISLKLASPEGEGFQPSPMETPITETGYALDSPKRTATASDASPEPDTARDFPFSRNTCRKPDASECGAALPHIKKLAGGMKCIPD